MSSVSDFTNSNESSSLVISSEYINSCESYTINQETEPNSDYDVSDCYDSDSDSDTDILSLCQMISESDENILFAKKGYRKLYKVCNTLQGDLYKAETVLGGQHVAIKVICKQLTNDKIAIQDGITFCVNENIEQEASILKQLNKSCNTNNIVRFVDFFESNTHFYLVTEYIEGMKLNQFIKTAHVYMQSGKLSVKCYQKLIKFIMWKLCNTLHILHDIHRCCHLDLCLDNIILENMNFIDNNGSICLPETDDISVKIIDFGVSQIFDSENIDFECYNHGLNIDNEAYYAPKIFDCDYYDARKADTWALGMILYECLTGNKLYTPTDMGLVKQNGYWSLHNDKLLAYINMNHLQKYFTKNSMKLLIKLLTINEQKRISSTQCIEHNYFKLYIFNIHA